MTSQDLYSKILELVKGYIQNFSSLGSNPQIRINPMTLDVEYADGRELQQDIADNDEAVESAAGAEGLESQDASDYQARQDPDYFSVERLLLHTPEGVEPDTDAIEAITRYYFN